MPFIVAQWNPTIDIFNLGAGKFLPLPLNTIHTYTAGTLVVKNRSYLDLSFLGSDGTSFYVEQEMGRAFHFDDFQTWNFTYMPINNSGMLSSSNLLPYQQVTMEIYPEYERVVEVYPCTFPVFSLPSTELVAHNSQLFMASNGTHTSPASGNIPMALFLPAQTPPTRVTVTILSVRVSTNVAVANAATIECKAILTDPALTSSITGVNMNNVTNGTTPLLKMEHQNTSVSVPAGTNLVTAIVDQDNTVTELIWPGMYVIEGQTTPSPGQLSAGLEFFFEPAIASLFSWTALWKEEQF